MLGEIVGDIGLALAAVALTALLLVAYVIRMREIHDLGITTMIAALLVFALGAMALVCCLGAAVLALRA